MDEPTVYRYGCADPTALNYDPDANTATNTCIYEEGCTNPSATNYDENAVLDDGTCNFLVPEGLTPAEDQIISYQPACLEP